MLFSFGAKSKSSVEARNPFLAAQFEERHFESFSAVQLRESRKEQRTRPKLVRMTK
jgi:hypothetical protein